jgi:hypothetical protein
MQRIADEYFHTLVRMKIVSQQVVSVWHQTHMVRDETKILGFEGRYTGPYGSTGTMSHRHSCYFDQKLIDWVFYNYPV